MKEKTKTVNPKKESIKFLLTYILIGMAWIIFSDKLLDELITDLERRSDIGLFKGIAYVLISAIIFSYIYSKKIKLLNDSLEEVESTYQNLILLEEELNQQYETSKEMNKVFRFELAVGFASEGLWDWDIENDNYLLSNRWMRNFGYQEGEIGYTFNDWKSIIHPEDIINVIEGMNEYLEQKKDIYEQLYRIRKKDGSFRWILSRGKAVWENNKAVRFSGSHNDITEKQELEKRLYNLAYYDSLTGLPNREMLEKKVNQFLQSNNDKKIGLLYIDIDDFKHINEIKGHNAGDALLKYFSKVLDEVVEEPNFFGKLAADEFIVVICDIMNHYDVTQYARKIQNALNTLWIYDSQEFYITTSIGGSMYPDHGKDFMSVLISADLARKNAKEKGKDQISIFNLSFRDKTLNYIEISNQLRKAIINKELTLFYQPQIDIHNNKVIGVEALVRWKHPKRGYIPPSVFIPVAEKNGIIDELNDYIFEQAFIQIREWRSKYPNIKVAINLSPISLRQDGLIIKLKKLIHRYGINASNIEIEITETAIFENIDKSIEILTQLRSIGIKIALDDFGSGYSSLTYLQRLPIDILKIDRGLIKTIIDDNDEAYILNLIIKMAHYLGLKVVAEGVETKEQLHVVYKHNCDYVQGFYFSKPVPKVKIDSDYLHHIV